ncbi:Geranylgeranyl diphosphate reductase, chloroplastic [Sesamum alatum]|uniref:Geranylgeranyl diphosphate reductase, chloroplastic n=1 Tax=Sesamum alatum TaxID=300844 RepID=A0AAE2CA03_9LAMI|nr:Geranylgeranyl diphosphate reductase, chloroplastic [Sesamum alatum]
MAAHNVTPVQHPFQNLTQSLKSRTFKPQTIKCIPAVRTSTIIISSKLRVAVIGGGPAGSSAAEALASGGIETYLFERSPEAAKPCGGAIPLCMLEEFSIPSHLIDRKVTQMKIISPSNLTVDFGKTLKPHEFISMLRREVLDNFLRLRAKDRGATLIKALVTNIELPISERSPYIIHYISNNTHSSLAVDVIVGADGANSKVAKSIKAGHYTCAIAFQERIKLPEDKMKYYENLAEMYVGDDVSPDFYAWVFPKCDHVAVGTGSVCSKQNIKQFQGAIRNRVKPKIHGGQIIKVEAHPIPEHPRPTRVRGRVALVGDAAGYVTKCSGEGIYFAAKKRQNVRRSNRSGVRERGEDNRRSGFEKRRVFYGSNGGREALVELCGKEYVQRMTFESYLYKKLAKGNPLEDVRMAMDTMGSLIRCNIVGREMNSFDKNMIFKRL